MSLNLQSIIEAWTRFDMKRVQRDLDDKVIEIAQKLEEGDSSRKALVERTKEFRKSLTDEQRKLVGPLLKQFQQEVDGSTKRSKFMEQVLLGLYKQLIDLPDPGPALENAEVKFKKAEKMTVSKDDLRILFEIMAAIFWLIYLKRTWRLKISSLKIR